MSSTVKLPYIRFVKRVSNGASLSKYGYIGMMQQNADAIQSSPWVAASSPVDSITLTTNQLTKTDGVLDSETGAWTTLPTYTAYMADIYDCFKQAGDAVARNATMCGYAGCVAYRFKLPTSETANALNSISLALQRDRYLRAGVRVGLALSNSDAPSDDWSVVRGEATGCVRSESTAPAEGVVGVSSFGFLGQPDVQYLTASRAASGVLALDTSTAFAEAASFQYLFLYITLEDPSAYWNLYKATEQRQYYIEGSAMLVADNCTFTFANAPAEATPEEIEIGFSSITQLGISTDLFDNITSLDLQPHPNASTDVVVISRCGAPVVLSDSSNNFVGVGMSGYVDYTYKFNSLGDGEPEDAVRSVYAEFYKDNLVRCPMKGQSSLVSKPAASFSVSFVFPGHDTQQIGKNISIQRKKLLVPFSVPLGFRPSKIRLDWQGYNVDGGTTINSAIKMRHNVWLAPGRDLANNYGDPVLKRHELYTAELSSVGGFVLLGSSIHSNDGNAVSETVDIPLQINHGPHTILLTLFIDEDQLTFGEGGTASQYSSSLEEYIPVGVIFGYRNPTIYGNENTMVYGGALSGGWSPTITLIS